MNWGKGIIIAMLLFIGFILFLVINLMVQRVDLQSEDYYQREINYEEEINQVRNANALPHKVKLLKQATFIVVQLPDSIALTSVVVSFIRPDDQQQDKQFRIQGTRSFLIHKSKLTTGKYMVEIRYDADGKHCLQKETIFI